MSNSYICIHLETYTTNKKTAASGLGGGPADIGLWAYAAAPQTHLFCVTYRRPGDEYSMVWRADCQPLPLTLQNVLHEIGKGTIVQTYDSFYLFALWFHLCTKKLDWPPLFLHQIRSFKSRVVNWALPEELNIAITLMNKPQQQISLNSLVESPVVYPDGLKYWNRENRYYDAKQYINSFVTAGETIPELTTEEHSVSLSSTLINVRGILVDRPLLASCIRHFEQIKVHYTNILNKVMGCSGVCITQTSRIHGWLLSKGLDADQWGQPGLDYGMQQVIKIMKSAGTCATLQKFYAMRNFSTLNGRIHDAFVYMGARRTGRWTGKGAQLQNLASAGPPVGICPTCGKIYTTVLPCCPCCQSAVKPKQISWSEAAMDSAAQQLEECQTSEELMSLWPDPLLLLRGMLRGCLVSAPGMDLIGADFKAIEAVVLAFLAGEVWRRYVFASHGLIYEKTAAKITGVPFETIRGYPQIHGGLHHPARALGKVAELASGYGGGLKAWKNFGADKFLKDEEIQRNVGLWRQASPMIVKFWNELENLVKAAIRRPGQWFSYRRVSCIVHNGMLYLQLPSHRLLSYHKPSLRMKDSPWGPRETIFFWGWDSKLKQWKELDTYGGRLVENYVQAVARDIQGAALVRLEDAQFRPVFHAHDEIVGEIDTGTRSLADFEKVMAVRPPWAAEWPIRTSGGWRGKRYRK